MQLRLTKSLRSNLIFGAFAFGLLFFTGVSQARADAVADLKTSADKIEGIYDNLVPPAVGSTAFLIAAKVLKRVALA
jgi:hypothetical protein